MFLQRCWKHHISTLQTGVRIRCYGSKHGITLDAPVQSYISRTSDPYLNLSIEHHLLQKSHPESTILFLYVNRPSVIIGRNQNPWLEVNLQLLKAAKDSPKKPETEPPGLGDVDLVRRRSGGGTVFHDQGNVNWTVISPSSAFTRDKHAEMVTRALRTLGVGRARVNERHDIVLDQGSVGFDGTWGRDADTHSTPWQVVDGPRPLKVSGSAYKLTRARALHHGTALLGSPNLNIIPSYLRSPAKGFIKGRGVDSVSSPVGNILVQNEEFIEEVQREFGEMYKGAEEAKEVGDECLEIEDVLKGYKELKSPEWTFLQTPQFTFSDVPVKGPDAEIDYSDAKFRLDVRYGAITGCNVQFDNITAQQSECLSRLLDKRQLHGIDDWDAVFKEAGIEDSDTAKWVQDMLWRPQE